MLCEVCIKKKVDGERVKKKAECLVCTDCLLELEKSQSRIEQLEEQVALLEQAVARARKKRQMPRGTEWDGEKYVEPDPSYKS